MDFGFGRFLEMFEERFGRRPTTVLLLMVGLAVVAFCVNLLWVNAILPVIKPVIGDDAVDLQVTEIVGRIVTYIIIVIVATPALVFLTNRLWLVGIKGATQSMKLAVKLARKQQKRATELTAHVEKLMDSTEKAVDATLVHLDRVGVLIDQMEEFTEELPDDIKERWRTFQLKHRAEHVEKQLDQVTEPSDHPTSNEEREQSL